jgi:hypothetical protein
MESENELTSELFLIPAVRMFFGMIVTAAEDAESITEEQPAAKPKQVTVRVFFSITRTPPDRRGSCEGHELRANTIVKKEYRFDLFMLY